MDELDSLLETLSQKFVQDEIRGLFSGLHAGFWTSFIVSYGDEWVDLIAQWFVPGTGFSAPKEDHVIRESLCEATNCNLHLCPGIQVICDGELTSGSDSTHDS